MLGDATDRTWATLALTGFASPIIDCEAVWEIAEGPIHRREIPQGRTTGIDRLLEDGADRSVQVHEPCGGTTVLAHEGPGLSSR